MNSIKEFFINSRLIMVILLIFIYAYYSVSNFYYRMGFLTGYSSILWIIIFNISLVILFNQLKTRYSRNVYYVSVILLNAGFLFNYSMLFNPLINPGEIQFKTNNKEITRKYPGANYTRKNDNIYPILNKNKIPVEYKINNELIKVEAAKRHFELKKHTNLVLQNKEFEKELPELNKYKHISLNSKDFNNYISFHFLALVLIITLLIIRKKEYDKVFFYKISGTPFKDFYKNNINKFRQLLDRHINSVLIAVIILSSIVAYSFNRQGQVHYFIFYALIIVFCLPYALNKHIFSFKYMDALIIHRYATTLIFTTATLILLKAVSGNKTLTFLKSFLDLTLPFLTGQLYNNYFLIVLFFLLLAYIFYILLDILIIIIIPLFLQLFKILVFLVRNRPRNIRNKFTKAFLKNFFLKTLTIQAKKLKDKVTHYIPYWLKNLNNKKSLTAFLSLALMLPAIATTDGGITLFITILTLLLISYLISFSFKVLVSFLYAGSVTILSIFLILVVNPEKTVSKRIFHYLTVNRWFDLPEEYRSMKSYILDDSKIINYDLAYVYRFIYDGGFWGNGVSGSISEMLSNINRDYVYASITEHTGLAGALIILFCILIYTATAFLIADTTSNYYYKSISAGAGLFLLVSAFITISGNLWYMPMTGFPLIPVAYSKIGNFCFIIFTSFLLSIAESTEHKVKQPENITTV